MRAVAAPEFQGRSTLVIARRIKIKLMNVSIKEARAELEAAQSALDTALRAWDESVAELWRTSLTLTQAQKRVTRAHELLRTALDEK